MNNYDDDARQRAQRVQEYNMNQSGQIGNRQYYSKEDIANE